MASGSAVGSLRQSVPSMVTGLVANDIHYSHRTVRDEVLTCICLQHDFPAVPRTSFNPHGVRGDDGGALSFGA